MESSREAQIEHFWDRHPCDSDRSDRSKGEIEYFQEIERDRYTHQAHIIGLLDSISLKGKRVLEVGTGVGTDARALIARGALYSGVNIDHGSTAMTMAALRAFNLPGRVEQADATALPYEDASFDVVYSYGVLHHIPNVATAVSEIYRVLRPGGLLVVMVYNRDSINYRIEIMFLRKLFVRALLLPGVIGILGMLGYPKDKLARHRDLYRASPGMSDDEWLSRNTDGPDNPYSKVYDRKEAEALLAPFQVVRNDVYFFDYRHWGPIGRCLPRSAIDRLGRRWGWHRVVLAKKPESTDVPAKEQFAYGEVSGRTS